MRRDQFDALADLETRGVGIHDERADTARARRLAGTGEDDVEVGDAAVGNPGLGAVQHIVVAVQPGFAGQGGHVRPGVR
ncbi:hypothetical protein G6F64_015241 [Rhizopus arrhizus]|uniref:Uncharacterized protein n=1 Tax=Rhizopus oryzae TaxID=64495 RepID=A0A9P7BIQ8_RHIOR|nr:hypothetical protein G6F64_015241 [Rhizopus arrhizus]